MECRNPNDYDGFKVPTISSYRRTMKGKNDKKIRFTYSMLKFLSHPLTDTFLCNGNARPACQRTTSTVRPADRDRDKIKTQTHVPEEISTLVLIKS